MRMLNFVSELKTALAQGVVVFSQPAPRDAQDGVDPGNLHAFYTTNDALRQALGGEMAPYDMEVPQDCILAYNLLAGECQLLNPHLFDGLVVKVATYSPEARKHITVPPFLAESAEPAAEAAPAATDVQEVDVDPEEESSVENVGSLVKAGIARIAGTLILDSEQGPNFVTGYRVPLRPEAAALALEAGHCSDDAMNRWIEVYGPLETNASA